MVCRVLRPETSWRHPAGADNLLDAENDSFNTDPLQVYAGLGYAF
jgi:hypothetical protein